MKMHLWAAIVATCVRLDISGAQTPAEQSSTPPNAKSDSVAIGQITAAEAREDFDLMRNALEEAHAGLYRYSTKRQMDRGLEVQRGKLVRALKKTEFMGVVGETIASIRCGHTSWKPDLETQKIMENARLCPLRMQIEGKRWMVRFNDTSDDDKIRPGMEVLEINGHKMRDLLRRFRPMASADGDIETGSRMQLGSRFGLYYWWLVGQEDTFTVKARDEAGRTVTATLSGVTDAERKKNQNPVNSAMRDGLTKLTWTSESQALRFLKGPEIAEIRLRSFMGSDYRKWIEETFKKLQEEKTKALIIDLRGNAGGKDMYGALLVSYLTDKPFRYFDRINLKTLDPSFKAHSNWRVDPEWDAKLHEGTRASPAGGYFATEKLHPGLAEQPPGKHPFLGKVFVLVDGGVFSTAADFCAVIRHLKRATFIGEETGGGYHGNNSGMEVMLTLPHSKLQIRLPMFEYWNAVAGEMGPRRGTIPDYVVATKTAKLLRGVDEPLEVAWKLAAKSFDQERK